jgi:hypothetical protein
MPSPRRAPRRASSAPPPSPAGVTARERRDSLVVKLQIAAAVFGPMLLLGVWLQSRGFFGAPGL